jgi:hypothetical protein
MSAATSSAGAATVPAKRPERNLAARPAPAGEPVPTDQRLYAKDIATLEKISVRTAQRLMAGKAFGRVRGRSRMDRWVPRSAYLHWLATI